jgi:hypothetical protein
VLTASLSDVEDPTHGTMRDLPRQPDLPHRECAVESTTGHHALERHGDIERRVVRPVHLPHAAPPQEVNDPIAACVESPGLECRGGRDVVSIRAVRRAVAGVLGVESEEGFHLGEQGGITAAQLADEGQAEIGGPLHGGQEHRLCPRVQITGHG